VHGALRAANHASVTHSTHSQRRFITHASRAATRRLSDFAYVTVHSRFAGLQLNVGDSACKPRSLLSADGGMGDLERCEGAAHDGGRHGVRVPNAVGPQAASLRKLPCRREPHRMRTADSCTLRQRTADSCTVHVRPSTVSG